MPIIADDRPAVMGIVNATPDSFSDGAPGRTLDALVAHALRLVDEGADLVDVGGESSRPGAEPVTADEEARRVLPVIEALAASASVPISVDTTKAEVARLALLAGASIINDISALGADHAMSRVVADSGAAVVLMHMRGRPDSMQDGPHYDDVVSEVYDFLSRRINWAESRGIPRVQVAIDPGIGFGKTFDHNMVLLRNLERFANLGCAALVGTSRKGFLGALTGRPVDRRETGSVVSSLAAVSRGADVVRVHDVGPMVDALKVWGALHGWDGTS